MDFAWWYHNAVGISKYIPCINDIQQCDRHIHVQIRTGRPVGGCGLRRAVIRLIYEIFEIFKIYHRTSDIAHCTLGVENEYRENVVTVRLYYPRHTRLNKEIVRCTSYEYRYDRLWYATTKNKKQDGRLRLCGQDQKSRTWYNIPGQVYNILLTTLLIITFVSANHMHTFFYI